VAYATTVAYARRLLDFSYFVPRLAFHVVRLFQHALVSAWAIAHAPSCLWPVCLEIEAEISDGDVLIRLVGMEAQFRSINSSDAKVPNGDRRTWWKFIAVSPQPRVIRTHHWHEDDVCDPVRAKNLTQGCVIHAIQHFSP
jgi:hypothetical protein